MPFSKDFGQGFGIRLTRGFTVVEVFSTGLVRSPIVDPDLRSPFGFDSGLSPSAQDDTETEMFDQSLDLRRICWTFGVILKLEFTLDYRRYFLA